MFKIISILRIYLFLSVFIAPCAYTATKIPPAPKFPVASYILMDADTGLVLAQQDSDKRILPASTTKLMTAYLVEKAIAQGQIHEHDLVTISDNAERVEGSRIYLKANMQVPVEVLLNGMIIVSGNDASIALAEHVAGSQRNFSALMNQEAQRLGMNNSNFVNPNGLPDKNHYSSSRDLALVAQAIINDYPESYWRYSTPSFSFNTLRKENSNLLLKDKNGVDGMKTGYTHAAKYCLVSSAKHDDMRLIAVVMGAQSIQTRNQQIRDLFNYGFRYYQTSEVYSANETISTLPVRLGAQKQVNVGLNEDLYITIPGGEYSNVEATLNIPERMNAPIASDQKIGNLKLSLNGKIIADRPVYTLETIDKGSVWQRSKEYFHEFFE